VKPDSGQWDLERLRPTDAPELHRALDAVKQRLPDPQQLAALAASLSQIGIAVSSASPTAATTASSATRLKLLLGAGVVGPLTLALLLWPSPAPHAPAPIASTSPATSAAPLASGVETPLAIAVGSNGVRKPAASLAESNAAPSSPPSPSSKASEPATTSPEPQPAASPGSAKLVPRVAAAPTASAEKVRSPVSPDRAMPESIDQSVVARPTELALLRDARLALSSNPNEALALTEQHRALFAHGAMVQERELIAISALARLGRHTAVLTRAAQFERNFPSSPYRKQVSALAQ
jgi:hypothetical protein